MRGEIPKAVLGDAIAEAVGARRVRAAVFTTFSFDPGFFELYLLPVLFDRSFSQAEKVCRIQLEEALRDVRHGVAVYYDRGGLVGEATAAQLDFRRIAVKRRNGVFHPKVVLILVENALEEEEIEEGYQPDQSLVVATLSANLTRSGWWENVEVGHVEVIDPPESRGEVCPFRDDLLKLVRQIRGSAVEGEEHVALDAVHQFLLREAPRRKAVQRSVQGVYRTRLFCGQAPLGEWLRELRLQRRDWNLEIISPYLDARGAPALERLTEAIAPREVRIHLPRDGEGRALVTEEQFEAVRDSGARWSRIEEGITRPGGGASPDKVAPRRVHAKLYRFWSRQAGEVVLVGSPNLTLAAHGRAAAGNLEAAFLVDRSDFKGRTWWLTPLDREPGEYASEVEAEDTDSEMILFDLALRFDWATGDLEYRAGESWSEEVRVETLSGTRLFTLRTVRAGSWTSCGAAASEAMGEVIAATSLVVVRTRGASWRILVREEGMGHKPSLIERLTPEEILLYWSLLSPEQREAFLEEKLAAEAVVEGLAGGRRGRFATTDTLFDRFAGLYHAFERLRRHVTEALEDEREGEAAARLWGAKYDSLPVLLQKVVERKDGDPILDYVTFLCGRQILGRVARGYPEFVGGRSRETAELERLLSQIPDLRGRIEMEGADAEAWLDWYEGVFLAEADELERSS